MPHIRFLFNQVYHAFKFVFSPDRYLDRYRICVQLQPHLLYRAEKIRPDPVHFIDKRYARNMVFLSLAPDRFRLRLDTTYRAENRYGSVQNTQ